MTRRLTDFQTHRLVSAPPGRHFIMLLPGTATGGPRTQNGRPGLSCPPFFFFFFVFLYVYSPNAQVPATAGNCTDISIQFSFSYYYHFAPYKTQKEKVYHVKYIKSIWRRKTFTIQEKKKTDVVKTS